MRLNLFEKIALGACLLVICTTAVYRSVLSDEQRDALREGADAIRSAVDDVTDAAAPIMSNGPTRREEEAAAAASRAHTKAQWEALGY